VLGSYTHRFLKHGEALLTDLPGLRLCLPELCLCLPSCVCNGKAEQQWKVFRKCTSILKDAYRMLGSTPYHVVYINCEVSHKYKLEDIVNSAEVCLRQGMRLIAKSKPVLPVARP